MKLKSKQILFKVFHSLRIHWAEIQFHLQWLRLTFPKLASEPFYYREMSQNWPAILIYFQGMNHTFLGIIHLCIRWNCNWFLVKVNYAEIGERPWKGINLKLSGTCFLSRCCWCWRRLWDILKRTEHNLSLLLWAFS